MEESSPPRRPSLYTAIRLARMVQHVGERLKAKVMSRAKRNAMLQCKALEAYSLDTAWRVNTSARVRDVPPNLQKKRRLYRAIARRDNNFTGLLQEFEDHVAPGGLPLSVVAAQDRLFLKHSAAQVDVKRIQDASHILDVSTLLIERLQYARTEKVWERPESKHLDSLEYEKYLANLEHLLMCFQHAALEALIHHSLHKLQSDYQHWDQYLEQQKKINDGCISEYAGDRPPLNSTMPWNIKPSLMVLWGVCWMFYNSINNNNNPQNNRASSAGARQIREAEGVWNQQQQQTSLNRSELQGYGAYTSPSPHLRHRTNSLRHSPPSMNPAAHGHMSALGLTGLGMHVTEPYHVTDRMYQTSDSPMTHTLFARGGNASAPSSLASLQAAATLPSQGSGRQMAGTPKAISYINTASANNNGTPSSSSDATFATLSPSWPQDPGSGNSYAVSHTQSVWQPSPGQTNISTPATNFSYPHSANSVTSHATQYEVTSTSAPSNNTGYSRGFAQTGGYTPFNLGLIIPMQESQAYPSPHSEASVRAASVCPVNMAGSTSPMMHNDTSPSAEYSPTSHSGGGFSSREPPRDQFGQIFCDHAECAQNPPTFTRKCEWSKHMDKHTRPYVCRQPGCEKIRGFTYSGGLLRHEREVHKKYGGPKAPRFCPHRDCKRSTGTGFSRKENLHEHLRRVHRGVGISDDDAPVEEPKTAIETVAPANALTTTPPESASAKKRKRSEVEIEQVAAPVGGGIVGEEGVSDLRAENKKLRSELAARDQRLKVLEEIVFRSMNQPMRPQMS